MTVSTAPGYSWNQGRHARILHAGNRLRPIEVTATQEAVAGSAGLADNPLTRDRWVPLENQIASPEDFSTADWAETNVTIATGGQRISETAANGLHAVEQDYTFPSAQQYVVSALIDARASRVREFRLLAEDGTTTFSAFFDLRDMSVGTVSNATQARVIERKDGSVLCLFRVNAAAAAGSVQIALSDGSETVSYTGDADNYLTVRRVTLNQDSTNIDLRFYQDVSPTCFAVAAHNAGSNGVRLGFQYENAGGSMVQIASVEPTDDSPVMFFFDGITSDRWRIRCDFGVLPEIGVFWVGNPLTMQRPFYGGFSPSRMARQTEVIGNISRTGELLGRSVRRTILSEAYQWQNLTYDWVRSNLDGPQGLIQSVEAEPCFVAWRPELTQDVSYLMRAQTTAPQAMGMRDLWSFSMNGEAYSYE